MENFEKKFSKEKNLIVFITTTQSPHLEAAFHYAHKNQKLYKDIYFVDIFSNVLYRHEYIWRNNYSIKINLARKIRNGINKIISLKYKKYIYKNKFRFIKVDKTNNVIKNENLIHSILATYSGNENGVSYLKKSKYDKDITKSVYIAMSITQNFLDKYNIKKKDDFLLFNGRLPLDNGIKNILIKNKFRKIIYHESNQFDKKIIFARYAWHNLAKHGATIHDYYLRNKKTVLNDWFNFKKIKFKKKKFNYVTYFTSSNDEYKFAYKKPVDQPQIIKKLINLNLKKYKLKIRVHPVTINKNLETRRYWDRLKKIYPNIFINYDEIFLSHDLCNKSILTLSIGSSTAAESLILDTPHILIGKQHWYVDLPGYHKCNEKNFTNFIKKIIRNDKYKKKFKIKEKYKKIAAASFFFRREMGEKVKLFFLGKYPDAELKKIRETKGIKF